MSDAERYQIPLIEGGTVVIEGPFPISVQDWDQFMTVLEAMKPGLIEPGLIPHSEETET